MDGAAMDEEMLGLLAGVLDHELDAALRDHDAAVADLAAGLGVKWRLVEDHQGLHPVAGLRRARALDDDGPHHALGALGGVAEELAGAELVAKLEPDRLGRRGARTGPGGAGLGALARHGLIEALGVDGDTAAAERVLGEVEGKAVGIVEAKGGRARELVAGAEPGRLLVEEAEAARQGLLEAALLELQGLGDQRLGARQLGKHLAHLGHQRRHQAPHQGLGAAHELGVAHGPAHDAAQHVAAALVRRRHPVGDEEGRGPQVVGDDAVGHRVLAVGGRARGLGRGQDEGAQKVGVIVVVLALEHRGDALEPHAGVDRGARQVDAPLGRDLLELHEHQVPDLDVAVAVLVGAAGRAAGELGSVVVEDLGAGAARAGLAHGPEVGRGRDADDARLREPRDLAPQREGVVVVVIDRDPEALGREAELPRHQVPGQLDGQVLEVVAEREVAQHLEEGVVAGGVADVVEVVVLAAGAHALLARGGAVVVARFGAGEDVLELHHARVDEHQGRVVVGDERARGHHLMSVGGEVIEKGLADIARAFHA